MWKCDCAYRAPGKCRHSRPLALTDETESVERNPLLLCFPAWELCCIHFLLSSCHITLKVTLCFRAKPHLCPSLGIPHCSVQSISQASSVCHQKHSHTDPLIPWATDPCQPWLSPPFAIPEIPLERMSSTISSPSPQAKWYVGKLEHWLLIKSWLAALPIPMLLCTHRKPLT